MPGTYNNQQMMGLTNGNPMTNQQMNQNVRPQPMQNQPLPNGMPVNFVYGPQNNNQNM